MKIQNKIFCFAEVHVLLAHHLFSFICTVWFNRVKNVLHTVLKTRESRDTTCCNFKSRGKMNITCEVLIEVDVRENCMISSTQTRSACSTMVDNDDPVTAADIFKTSGSTCR